ncbi:unnamed protein product, partial [Phaeothamnion confervicola]
AGAAFLAAEANKDGAVQTPSGLVIHTTKKGQGPSPSLRDTVRVHYHGTLIDGTVFDSSVERGKPISFALNQVIVGWQEGLRSMKTGGTSRLVIPSELAYGDRGAGRAVPPGSVLVFDVQLLAVE